MDFFTELNYSIGNEDWLVEEQALRVQPDDKVVCVTASGDRPLHLLLTECSQIFSVDMNHSQNCLLDLKLAAIAELDYEKYLAFLGFSNCASRLQIFQELIPRLSNASIQFWNEHSKMISRGVIYQGRTERLMQLIARIYNLVRGNKIKKLFSFDDLTAQKQFVTEEWDTKSLRRFFEFSINPKISQFLIKDPGFNSYVDYAVKPGKYIYDRMLQCLNTHLAKKSALLQLLFTGKLKPDCFFPYLTFDGYTKIRCNMNRVTIINANTIDFLNSPELLNQINCFSMSDIASYMPQSVFEKLLLSIQSAAKPNARFCLREFISNRKIPASMQDTYRRNHNLEKKLELEETNFVYRFMVGEINK